MRRLSLLPNALEWAFVSQVTIMETTDVISVGGVNSNWSSASCLGFLANAGIALGLWGVLRWIKEVGELAELITGITASLYFQLKQEEAKSYQSTVKMIWDLTGGCDQPVLSQPSF